MSENMHDPETCGCGTDAEWCPYNPDASELAPARGSAAWVKCTDRMPPRDTNVETKIDDAGGCRNVTLLRHRGLWWFPDMSMYVYYSPTHWRSQPPNNGGEPLP